VTCRIQLNRIDISISEKQFSRKWKKEKFFIFIVFAIFLTVWKEALKKILGISVKTFKEVTCLKKLYHIENISRSQGHI